MKDIGIRNAASCRKRDLLDGISEDAFSPLLFSPSVSSPSWFRPLVLRVLLRAPTRVDAAGSGIFVVCVLPRSDWASAAVEAFLNSVSSIGRSTPRIGAPWRVRLVLLAFPPAFDENCMLSRQCFVYSDLIWFRLVDLLVMWTRGDPSFRTPRFR